MSTDGRSSNAAANNVAAGAVAVLITGPIFYTFVGWLLDRWLDTTPWLTLAGLLLGMALSVYLTLVRYGTFGSSSKSAEHTNKEGAR